METKRFNEENKINEGFSKIKNVFKKKQKQEQVVKNNQEKNNNN